MNKPISAYTSTGRAAKTLGLSIGAIQDLVDNGELTAWKTQGGHRRILNTSLESYIKNKNILTKNFQKVTIVLLDKDGEIYENLKNEFTNTDLNIEINRCNSAFEAIFSISKTEAEIFAISTSNLSPGEYQVISELITNKPKTPTVYVTIASDNEEFSETQLSGLDLIRAEKPYSNWIRGFVCGYVQSGDVLSKSLQSSQL